MPNQPKTPLRTFRLDDDLWVAFGLAADDRSAVVREFVRWYTRQPGAKMPKRPTAERTTDNGQSDDADQAKVPPHSSP